VIVVAAVIALPKGMIISKMKKGVLSIGPCKEMNDEKFKGPPWRAFFCSLARALRPCSGQALRALESTEGPEKKHLSDPLMLWHIAPLDLVFLSSLRTLWLNEKRTTVVYKAVAQQTKYTTKEVVQ
jgi:hypothetical protein